MDLKGKLENIKNSIYKIEHKVIEPDGGNCCPYCGHELEYHDDFGRFCAHQDGKHLGTIYKCPNEYCESEAFNYYFYEEDGGRGGLREGYPC